jgi:hypothetical protein
LSIWQLEKLIASIALATKFNARVEFGVCESVGEKVALYQLASKGIGEFFG